MGAGILMLKTRDFPNQGIDPCPLAAWVDQNLRLYEAFPMFPNMAVKNSGPRTHHNQRFWSLSVVKVYLAKQFYPLVIKHGSLEIHYKFSLNVGEVNERFSIAVFEYQRVTHFPTFATTRLWSAVLCLIDIHLPVLQRGMGAVFKPLASNELHCHSRLKLPEMTSKIMPRRVFWCSWIGEKTS